MSVSIDWAARGEKSGSNVRSFSPDCVPHSVEKYTPYITSAMVYGMPWCQLPTSYRNVTALTASAPSPTSLQDCASTSHSTASGGTSSVPPGPAVRTSQVASTGRAEPEYGWRNMAGSYSVYQMWLLYRSLRPATGFQAPWYTCFTPTSSVGSPACRAFITVKRLGSPAPKSFTTPSTLSLATYCIVRPARNTRTLSSMPMASASRMSPVLSSADVKLPVYMDWVSASRRGFS